MSLRPFRPGFAPAFVLLGLILVAGCGAGKQAGMSESDSLLASSPYEQGQGDLTPSQSYKDQPSQPRSRPAQPATHRVPSGTAVEVSLNTQISSETASVGDSWTGTVEQDIIVDRRVLIPAGSTVRGTVTGARGAQKGDRAMLALGISSINIDGRSYSVSGNTEPVVAGSTRARNLGAIAGSAAAGALIGKAVSGSGKGALIGGVIGGAAATGAVAKSKGYQVILKSGMSLTFVTNEPVAVRG